jgi:hypothetical protein
MSELQVLKTSTATVSLKQALTRIDPKALTKPAAAPK